MLNCIIIDDEKHAVEELTTLIGHINDLSLLKSFQDIKSAISFLEDIGHVDIIFSDIQMPAINGIDAARMYTKHAQFIVYVTAYRDFAVDAFGVNAAGYLMKPVRYTALAQQMNTILEKRKATHKLYENDAVLFLKGNNKNTFIKIRYEDITHIEALLNYVIVHTIHGNNITHIGLKGMEQILRQTDSFIRISKSAIISIHYLDRVDGNMVRLKGKDQFTVGEKYRNAFHEFLRKRTLSA